MDRATRPRVWAETEPVDPNLPIRGRYISLRPVVPVEAGSQQNAPAPEGRFRTGVRLQTLGTRLIAFADDSPARHPGWLRSKAGRTVVTLQEPLAFLIPPDVDDPSIRAVDDPLWVEVTLPRSGPPRPIQLGQRRGGRIVPHGLR